MRACWFPVVAVFIAGCPDEELVDLGGGSVTGSACFPNGDGEIAGAEVWIDLRGGGSITATTDGEGEYVLNGVPPGQHIVHVRAGAFEVTHEVALEPNATVAIPRDDCVVSGGATIAIVTGRYDRVRDVLDNVGIPGEAITTFDESEWSEALLKNFDALRGFQVVFLNCGADELGFLNDTLVQANLLRFVDEGGALYASDWAYDVVEKTFPEFIDFYGDDLVTNAAQAGLEQTETGDIVDEALADVLDTSVVALDYPFPLWAVVESVRDDVRVFIRGDARIRDGTTLTSVPHTVSFEFGEGRVTYSSFHQEPDINFEQERILQVLMFLL